MATVVLDSSSEVRAPVQYVGPVDRLNLDNELKVQLARAEAEREIAANLKTLPANLENSPAINFFGSSYSGADVKVIAHLYDTENWRDAELVKAEEEKFIADSVRDAANALASGGLSGLADAAADTELTYNERRQAFISATGLSEGDPAQKPALDILLSAVFKSGSFSFLATAKMQREANLLSHAYGARGEDLAFKIKSLQEIQGDSSSTVALGTLQTISVQTHRAKTAVRALGMSYAKAYVRGQRTIAGSMIFTVFDEHPLLKLIRAMGDDARGERAHEISTLIADQLPPIDLTIIFANEYGSLSDFRLYGVEFLNDGTTFSVEDLMSEEVMNFVCRDADVMTSRGKIRLSRLQTGQFNEHLHKDRSGSSLLFDNASYNEYLERLKVRRRLKNR